MKVQLYTIATEKLEAMVKRLRERIAEKDSKRDKTNLERIQKELAHRWKIRSTGKQEIDEIPVGDPHRERKVEEIELRTRLQLLDRNSLAYEKVYHRWFVIREKGVADGLYQFFVPAGRRK